MHSETGWKIASLYSGVLASETRDLAAHIDLARRQAAEEMRERCNDVAVEIYQAHIDAGNGIWAGIAEQIARRISALKIEGEDNHHER